MDFPNSVTLQVNISNMNLQYLSDDQGNKTGVFIPINEWNSIKRKYKGIEEEINEVPEWHKEIVLQRLKDYNR